MVKPGGRRRASASRGFCSWLENGKGTINAGISSAKDSSECWADASTLNEHFQISAQTDHANSQVRRTTQSTQTVWLRIKTTQSGTTLFVIVNHKHIAD